MIACNVTGKGGAVARGAARHGELLLASLLRCGHCGRKMCVAYGGKAGALSGALVNHSAERCISFGGLRADHAVGAKVLRVLKPLGHAAVRSLDALAGETSAAGRQRREPHMIPADQASLRESRPSRTDTRRSE